MTRGLTLRRAVSFCGMAIVLCCASCIGRHGAPGPPPARRVTGTFQACNGAGYDQLVLDGDGRFRFEIRASVGLVMVATGRAYVEPGRVRLQPEEILPEGGKFPPDWYYPVAWGDRLYLVRASEMDLFCDDVGRGLGTRPSSWFLLREGDETKAVAGIPEVPPAWRERLGGVNP
jgi:hypothetical protein